MSEIKPKNRFQEDGALSGQWRAIVHSEQWAKTMLYARSEFLDTAPTPEQQKGAKAFIDILEQIAEPEEADFAVLPTGLDHNMDNPAPKRKTEPKPKKDKK